MKKIAGILLVLMTLLVGGAVVYSYAPSIIDVAEAGGTGGSSG